MIVILADARDRDTAIYAIRLAGATAARLIFCSDEVAKFIRANVDAPIYHNVSVAVRAHRGDLAGAEFVIGIGERLRIPPAGVRRYHHLNGGFAQGIIAEEAIPARTMSVWDRERYDYDVIYTCLLQDESAVLSFADYVAAAPGQRKLLIVQLGTAPANLSAAPVVKEGSRGKVYRWAPNIDIIADEFTLRESAELFYYAADPVAVAPSWAVEMCLSYGRVPFIEHGHPLLHDYAAAHGFEALLPLFGFFNGKMSPAEAVEYVARHRGAAAELGAALRTDHNVLNRLVRTPLLAPPNRIMAIVVVAVLILLLIGYVIGCIIYNGR